MSSLIACVFTGGCCKARAVARVEYDVRREDTSPKYGLGINSACPYLANSRSCDWPENHHFLLLSLAHDILDLSFLSYPVERRPYFSQLRNPSPHPSHAQHSSALFSSLILLHTCMYPVNITLAPKHPQQLLFTAVAEKSLQITVYYFLRQCPDTALLLIPPSSRHAWVHWAAFRVSLPSPVRLLRSCDAASAV